MRIPEFAIQITKSILDLQESRSKKQINECFMNESLHEINASVDTTSRKWAGAEYFHSWDRLIWSA